LVDKKKKRKKRTRSWNLRNGVQHDCRYAPIPGNDGGEKEKGKEKRARLEIYPQVLKRGGRKKEGRRGAIAGDMLGKTSRHKQVVFHKAYGEEKGESRKILTRSIDKEEKRGGEKSNVAIVAERMRGQ